MIVELLLEDRVGRLVRVTLGGKLPKVHARIPRSDKIQGLLATSSGGRVAPLADAIRRSPKPVADDSRTDVDGPLRPQALADGPTDLHEPVAQLEQRSQPGTDGNHVLLEGQDAGCARALVRSALLPVSNDGSLGSRSRLRAQLCNQQQRQDKEKNQGPAQPAE